MSQEPPLDSRGDRDLLACFVADGREEAFAALVRRHGDMVLRVCRARLGNAADAEDAAQAVFLTLARRASSLTRHETLAGWLYRVSWYVAGNAARVRLTRLRHEQEAARMSQPANNPASDLPISPEALYAGLFTLAEKYRLPLILHHLQGKTEAETAALLGISVSAASVRLARGRQKLRSQLARLGAVSTVALTTALSVPASAVPTAFVTTATQTAASALAGHAVTGSIFSLSQGAIHMLFMAKMKLVAMVTAAVVLLGGAGVTTYVAVAAGRPAAPAQAPAPGEVTLRGQVFTQTGSDRLCDPDVYPLVMNVKMPQRVEMYFLKAGDLTRQFAREVAAKGAMQVVVVGKVAKEGIYDAVTVSRIEAADAATQPAARAAAAEEMPMAEMVKGEKVLVKFWHYPLVDHPNRPSDDDITAGRKKIGDKIAQALKGANVEAVRFLWGQDGQEGADRSSYSAMMLLDCKGTRPEKALADVPYRIAGIVFKDGVYERALPVEAESKWLITAKKGQVPARYAFYSRGGSAFAELQQGQQDVERFGKMAELKVDAIPPLRGAAGGGWSAKLTPAEDHTLLEVFILTGAGFQLVDR